MNNQTIRDVQKKILEIMMYIDRLCRDNDIVYYIMGGTALGAVRHGGFIPWDDDLDIFMTPDNYKKFKTVFEHENNTLFILQEWRVCKEYLEYAKVRMNGTTFIESNFKHIKDMHHGIYVDIMILHKSPENIFALRDVYYKSKYITLYALSQRNWKFKTFMQKLALKALKMLPNKLLSKSAYHTIYKYDDLHSKFNYCYYITRATIKQGLFPPEMFGKPVDITFEDTILMGPTDLKGYLVLRYGNYMRLPSVGQQKVMIHAEWFDTEKSYEIYL